MLKKLLNNKVITFLMGRYSVYLIQFFNAILIAHKLGPYHLGIYGFFTLVMQYLSYSNLGVQYSLNAIISQQEKADVKSNTEVFSASFMLTCLIGVVLIVILCLYYLIGFSLFDKYNFNTYFIQIIIITVLAHFNQLFMNLYRSFGKLSKIIFSQAIVQLLIFPMVFIMKDESLFKMIVNLFIIGNIISLGVFFRKTPIKIKFGIIQNDIYKKVLKRGFYLLFYNVSFYFIMISIIMI